MRKAFSMFLITVMVIFCISISHASQVCQAENEGNEVDDIFTSFIEALKPAKLNDGSNTDYGFGWEFGKTESGHKYMKHDGSWLGFISYYVRFPEEHLSVIILLNRNYDLEDDLEMEIADIFLK